MSDPADKVGASITIHRRWDVKVVFMATTKRIGHWVVFVGALLACAPTVLHGPSFLGWNGRYMQISLLGKFLGIAIMGLGFVLARSAR